MTQRRSAGRAGGTHRQALRLLALVQHLEAHRGLLPTRDVARELGVSERQLRRDADALVDAGYDVELDVADGGVKVTTAEVAVDADDDVRGECLNELISGLVRSVRVEATYRSANERVRAGRFAPHGLALYRHGLYFVGTWDEDPERRIFAAERFQSAERVRGDRFETPADFHVRDFFQGAFGIWVSDAPEDVVLELGPGSFELVAMRRYHPSQTIERTPRGTTLLRMRVGASPDLVSWVLGWGEHVVVHAPPSLRARVEDAHRAALAPRPWASRIDGRGRDRGSSRKGRSP